DHAVPFQRAMRLQATPPAIVNLPAATMSPFSIRASADTCWLQPVPRDDHVLPLQRAMSLAVMPPAEVNRPPTTTLPSGSVNSASTLVPAMPVPSGANVVPFHRAMRSACAFVTEVNAPPTIMSGPLGASARISPSRPSPNRGCQLVPLLRLQA